MFEASMNFDLENVEPFLKRLNSELHLELPVAELVAMTRAVTIDDEVEKAVMVRFGGTSIVLKYRVFMDDVEAPDLYFFTESQPLAEAIDEQLSQFADQAGL